MKKKFKVALVTAVFLSISLSSMAAEKIKMGYFNLIPHVFYNEASQKLQGASIDFFNAAAAAIGYEVEWTGPLPFPRLISYLKEGRVEGSIMMNKNPDRETFLYYPENPYYMVQRILVVRKDNKLDKITSINDILGYRVGFMKDAHLSPFIKDNQDKIKLELIGGDDWVKQNLLKLEAGRLEAVYDLNSETMMFEAKKIQLDDKIKILPVPEPAGGVNIVFSKASQNGKILIDKYQQAVQNSKLVYEDFLKSYMK